eukprot:4756176-Alexandrium_andersonii.AAC.1
MALARPGSAWKTHTSLRQHRPSGTLSDSWSGRSHTRGWHVASGSCWARVAKGCAGWRRVVLRASTP